MSALKKLVVAVVAATMSFGLFAETGDYSKYVDFTVSSDAVQSDGAVPVLVRLSEGSPVGFHYADVQSADGSDILCTSVDGETVYPCEVDTWDTNGESLLWVRLPDARQGATFRLWYGNAADSGDNVPAATWADYSGVWHFSSLDTSVKESNSQGVYANSTAATGIDGHLSTYSLSGETGVFGKCFRVNDSTASKGGNYMKGGVWVNDAGTDSPIDGGSQFTISGWFKHKDFGYYYDHVFYKRLKANNSSAPNNAFAIECATGNAPNPYVRGSSGSGSAKTLANNLLDTWGYLTFVFDGTKCYLYENGKRVTGDISIAACIDNDAPLVFGDNTDVTAGSGDAAWNGWIDEVRFSKGAKSADFIAAEYAAMTTADLLSAGPVQDNAVTPDLLVVRGSPLNIGDVTPAYGKTPDVAAGTVTCTAPEGWVAAADGLTRRYVTGWTLKSLDADRVVTRSTSGSGATCAYTHVAGESDQLAWLWSEPEVRLEIGSIGRGSVDGASGWYASGAQVTLTATAAEGGAFVCWQGDVDPTEAENPTITVTLDGAKTVKAKFRDSGFGVRYVTPTGNGTQDGLSWENAMTLANYLADCDPAVVAELRLSAGIHEVCNLTADGVKSFTDGARLTIRGGYAGTEGADEPPALPRTATIVSGDSGRNDVWARFDPETGELTATFDGETAPVLDYENGTYNPAPATVAKYDVCFPVEIDANGAIVEKLADDAKRFLYGVGTGAFVLENLSVAGMGQGTDGVQGAVIYTWTDAAFGQDIALTNVLIRGCSCKATLVQRYQGKAANPVSFVDCSVESCRAENGLFHCDSGTPVAERLTVSGCVAKASGSATAFFSVERGGNAGAVTVTDSTFERVVILKDAQNYSSYNYGGMIFGTYNQAMTLTNVKLSRCFVRMTNAMTASRDAANVAQLVYCGGAFLADGLRLDENRVEYAAVSANPLTYSAFLKCGSSGNNVLRNSSFTSNEVFYTTAVTPESYVAPIAAEGRFVIGNASFYGNSVAATATGDGCAAPVVSRALLERVTAANSTANWLFVRSCTFGGATAGDDFVHAGDFDNPRRSYVIDSILWSDAPGTAYRGVTADRLGGVWVMNSIVKNADAVHPAVDYVDVHEDDPVLAWDAATGFAKPTVRVPGVSNGGSLYECGNVAHYAASDDLPDHVGTYPWAYLAWGWCKDAARHPAPDALGAERPLGAGTLGAVQVTFGDDPVVVARVRPTSGGTVKGASQTVVGGVAGAMTAVAEDGYSFLGWYDAPEGGTRLSPDATYTPEATTDTAVYARFGAGAVQWTFDLGEYGTFDGSGEAMATVEAHPGESAPAVPAFTLKPEWHFAGWTPEIPAQVATGDKTFDVTVIPSFVTVFFDTHATAGDGSGRDWANATTNLTDAFTAAAAGFEAEIRVKRGFHVPTRVEDVHPFNTVRLVGGWTGEGDARTDDPEATIFSGDVNGDDVWNGPDGVSRGAVIVDRDGAKAFAAVNPDKADAYWRLGNYSDNLARLIDLEMQATTANLTVEGVSFTGYGRNTGGKRGSAIHQGVYSVLTVSNCLFVANNELQSGDFSGLLVFRTAATVTDCRFVGNWGRAMRTISSVGWGNGEVVSVVNCEFDRMAQTDCNGLVAWRDNTYGNISLRGCDIHDCHVQNVGAEAALFSNVQAGMSDCRIANNVATNAYGTYSRESALSSPSFGYCESMTNCVFEGNRLYVDPEKASVTYYPSTLGKWGNNMALYRCSFTGNVVVGGRHPASAIVTGGSGAVNCSFVGNEATSETGEWTCTAAQVTTTGFANCTFLDNGAPSAEIAFVRTWEGQALGICNCVFWNEQADYRFHTNATEKVNTLVVSYTTAKNLTDEGETNLSDNPGFADKLYSNGRHQYALFAGRAPSSRHGCRIRVKGSVWQFPKGDGTWRQLNSAAWTVKEADLGVELDEDLLGNAYKDQTVFRGAVQDKAPQGFGILVR